MIKVLFDFTLMLFRVSFSDAGIMHTYSCDTIIIDVTSTDVSETKQQDKKQRSWNEFLSSHHCVRKEPAQNVYEYSAIVLMFALYSAKWNWSVRINFLFTDLIWNRKY